MTARAIDRLVVVALVVLVLVVWKLRSFDPAVVPPQSFGVGNGDFYTQLYPMWFRAAEWIRHGVLPLWNPYQFCGHPFLATGIYGVLYPFNAFHLIMPSTWAIEVGSVFHLAVAGIGTYAYARTIALRPIAAATAAVGYMLSGFVVGEALWFPPSGAAAAWLPIALLGVEQIAQRRTIAWSFVLAAALALAYLSGWPQTWIYSVYAAGAYALVRLVGLTIAAADRRGTLRPWLLVAVGFVTAFGLMAAQLLPSLELQSMSPRKAGGLSLRQIMPFGVFPPQHVVKEAVDATPAYLRFHYLGIAPLLLIALAVQAGRRLALRAAFFALLAVFAIGVTLGTRLLDLYLLVPGFAWFRGPTRFMFVHALAGAMLSGIGAEALARGGNRRLSVALVLGAAAALVATVWWVGAPLPVLSRWYLGLALVLLLGAVFARDGVRRAIQVCLVLLIAWDLGYGTHNTYTRPLHNPRLFDGEARLFDAIKASQGLDRTYIRPASKSGALKAFAHMTQVPLTAKQGTLRELYSITDYEPLSSSRYRKFYARIEAPADRLPEHRTFTGTLTADPRRPEFRMLDLMSVRFVVVPRYDAKTYSGLLERGTEWREVPAAARGLVSLFERTDVLPRAYVAFDARRVAGENYALEAVADPGFDPRRTVVLEQAQAAPPAAEAPAAIAPARIVSYEPTRVEIETDTAASGHLVLTDTFYPGWHASVDGEGRPIVQANYLFRAVEVPAGRHVVIFDYAPASFRIGAALTLLTLAFVAIATTRSLRRAR